MSHTKSLCGLESHDIGRVHEKNWVMISVPEKCKTEDKFCISGFDEDLAKGPAQVIHDTEDRVWISSHYSEEWPEEVKPVGDTLNNGFDVQGNSIVSIPVSWCTFYNEKDANGIQACIDADEKLLGQAH